jgi:ABC-2 type transport system permease protein
MNVMIMLMRRELWEHRALWIAPLLVPVLVLVFVLIGPINAMPFTDEQMRRDLGGSAQLSTASFQFWIASIVVFFYLLDCLFTERRDRSILFWKSMPVSDTATVLSKLLIALVVVPVGVYVIAALTNVLSGGLSMLRSGLGGEAGLLWDAGITMKVQLMLLIAVVVSVLWYAPVAGYLLLVSVLARRTPFLWAVLPPFVLSIGEWLTFRTHYVSDFIVHRLSSWYRLVGPSDLARTIFSRSEPGSSIDAAFAAIDVSRVLTSLSLWGGLVAAALLVYAAIFIRSRRDDA